MVKHNRKWLKRSFLWFPVRLTVQLDVVIEAYVDAPCQELTGLVDTSLVAKGYVYRDGRMSILAAIDRWRGILRQMAPGT